MLSKKRGCLSEKVSFRAVLLVCSSLHMGGKAFHEIRRFIMERVMRKLFRKLRKAKPKQEIADSRNTRMIREGRDKRTNLVHMALEYSVGKDA